MKRLLLILSLTGCVLSGSAQLHVARDLTSENLFSENIEGPNVDKEGNLFVVNAERDGTIGLVKPNGEVLLWLVLPKSSLANSIMFNENGNLLLADWKGHNILFVDKKTKAVAVYAHSDQFNQPNDLCINKKGQLFASDPDWKNSTGKLWRIDRGGGKPVLLKENMGTTNGIELSPDDKKLYVNESVQRKVWVFDVDKSGTLSNQKLFYQFDDFGLDGMKCDKKGNLYITRHGKGTVVVLSPKGELIREISVKGKSISNITFGGKDGKTCFVTLQDRKCIEMFENDIAGKNY